MEKAKAIEILNELFDSYLKTEERCSDTIIKVDGKQFALCDMLDEITDRKIALLTAIDALEQDSSVEAEPMGKYISKDDAVGAGYLSDWYISSVGDESPVWTDEHIDELLNDFLVIPKETPARPTRKRG